MAKLKGMPIIGRDAKDLNIPWDIHPVLTACNAEWENGRAPSVNTFTRPCARKLRPE